MLAIFGILPSRKKNPGLKYQNRLKTEVNSRTDI